MTDRQDQQLRPGETREREREDDQHNQDIAQDERLPEDESEDEDLPGAMGEEAGETGFERAETDDLEAGQPGRSQTEEPVEGSRELEEEGVEER